MLPPSLPSSSILFTASTSAGNHFCRPLYRASTAHQGAAPAVATTTTTMAPPPPLSRPRQPGGRLHQLLLGELQLHARNLLPPESSSKVSPSMAAASAPPICFDRTTSRGGPCRRPGHPGELFGVVAHHGHDGAAAALRRSVAHVCGSPRECALAGGLDGLLAGHHVSVVSPPASAR